MTARFRSRPRGARRAAPTAMVLGLVLAVAGAAPAFAAPPAPSDPTVDRAMVTAGFLDWHPDLRFRLQGLEQQKQGDNAEAFIRFRRAALYADKPSQGMVAEMLWNGTGTPRDRALAYAWMDLAAERGYVSFVTLRERYWNALDEAERARAVVEGEAVYARYGDAVATRRIDWAVRRGRKETTGSRTGAVGALQIWVPGPGGSGENISGTKYYASKYWDPKEYRAWHDSVWSQARVGTVTVGQAEAAGPGSRVPNQPAPAPPIDDDSRPDDLGDDVPGAKTP